MSADLNAVYRKQGVLWKRRRGKHGSTPGKNPNKFQRRLFKLTDEELLYYKEKKYGKYKVSTSPYSRWGGGGGGGGGLYNKLYE